MKYIYGLLLLVILVIPATAGIIPRAEVNLDENTITVYKGYKKEFEATIASGTKEKFIIRGNEYRFDTPTGYFRVYRKTEHPLWIPPDWYYEDTPPEIEDRVPQEGVLGDYSLSLRNDGIMIHGTQDESTMGQRVTHGCIRMRKEDLKKAYELLQVGSEVWIYGGD